MSLCYIRLTRRSLTLVVPMFFVNVFHLTVIFHLLYRLSFRAAVCSFVLGFLLRGLVFYIFGHSYLPTPDALCLVFGTYAPKISLLCETIYRYMSLTQTSISSPQTRIGWIGVLLRFSVVLFGSLWCLVLASICGNRQVILPGGFVCILFSDPD